MEADKAPKGVRERPPYRKRSGLSFQNDALIEEVFQKGIYEQVSLTSLVQHKCVQHLTLIWKVK